MRNLKQVILIFFAAIALSSVFGCASREAPTAAEIEKAISEARTEEVVLVRSTVADEGRADRVIALLQERDQVMNRYVTVLKQYSDDILQMNADYAVTRDQLEEKMTSYHADRTMLQKDFVDLIDAIKKETTADEWKSLAKYQLKKLNPRTLAYQQSTAGR